MICAPCHGSGRSLTHDRSCADCGGLGVRNTDMGARQRYQEDPVAFMIEVLRAGPPNDTVARLYRRRLLDEGRRTMSLTPGQEQRLQEAVRQDEIEEDDPQFQFNRQRSRQIAQSIQLSNPTREPNLFSEQVERAQRDRDRNQWRAEIQGEWPVVRPPINQDFPHVLQRERPDGLTEFRVVTPGGGPPMITLRDQTGQIVDADVALNPDTGEWTAEPAAPARHMILGEEARRLTDPQRPPVPWPAGQAITIADNTQIPGALFVGADDNTNLHDDAADAMRYAIDHNLWGQEPVVEINGRRMTAENGLTIDQDGNTIRLSIDPEALDPKPAPEQPQRPRKIRPLEEL